VSLRSDGTYRCDHCGTDVGNGAVTEAAIVSDIEGGGVRVLHFCRRPRRGAPNGCAGHLLGRAALADYLKEQS